MPFLLPTSSSKTTATVIIAGVLSVAAAVVFAVPFVSHSVASCFPIIYDNTVFLLKPPYLYLVINCIVVSIVATSKLTQKSYSSIDGSDIDTGYLNVPHVAASDYTGFVEDDAPTAEGGQRFPEVVDDEKVIIDDGEDQQTETETPKPSNDSPESETEKLKPSSNSPETKKPKPKSDSILKNTRKPPRFGQQKSLRNSPEGGGGNKKSALGVSKPPRRQDTLETTWKKITEGRSTPLTKHLTKSDTWQERTHVQSSKEKKMTKSENLNDINAPAEAEEEEETLRKTRLKREPSPGQEELNRRVEAFIKKFNEEMRLQRLESLAKYKEMVNGGTRL
ncbi:hypothetical protein EUTSA_v10014064mg [Eutrema salsugineum]|uniref:DUF4408 domain-containing protein n=1 Tax=Eutrema salsugineum TaxID=72664 RepID=V4KYK9_EUTSA|nr:uncharacterized protein LOC18016823 isoform X2 [Eutrema salsugineum]ESQ43040.1 hypothetical protein EUTSA_v10014064mg [Eutrema salsugineum]